jgi:tryptophan-rich sensory protein
MDTSAWYSQLKKPTWSPPVWLFGAVWTPLYIIIFITFGFVFWKAIGGTIPWLVALPFALNLLFNFIFTPIQFGLRSNRLALVDIFLVVGTLGWAFVSLYLFGLKSHIETGGPTYAWIIYLNLPYLLWGSFATVLQATITKLN